MTKRKISRTLVVIVVVALLLLTRPLDASAVASSRRPRQHSPYSSSQQEQGAAQHSFSKQQAGFPFHSNLSSASPSLIMRCKTVALRRRRPLALLHRIKRERGASSSLPPSSSSSSSSSSLSSTTAAVATTTPNVVVSKTINASASKLGALAAYFDACLIPQQSEEEGCGAGIDTQRFLEACRQLESFMVSVGHKQSAKDLLQNIHKIQGACAKTPVEPRQTILELLQHEKSTGIHDGLSKSPSVRILDEESGAMGLLWIKRSLSFQHTMYSLILDDPNMDGHVLEEGKVNTMNNEEVTQQQVSMTRRTTNNPHANDDDSLLLVENMSMMTAPFQRQPRRRVIMAARNEGKASSSRLRTAQMAFATTRTTTTSVARNGKASSSPLRTAQMVVATKTTTTAVEPRHHHHHSTTSQPRFKCPAEAAQVAYSRVLEPHHGWALRNIYALALRSTTPSTRRALLAELGGFQLSSSSSSLSQKEQEQLATAENDLRLLVTSWEPVRVVVVVNMFQPRLI
jgi:hypothetical protein